MSYSLEGCWRPRAGQRKVWNGHCYNAAYKCDPTAGKFPCVGQRVQRPERHGCGAGGGVRPGGAAPACRPRCRAAPMPAGGPGDARRRSRCRRPASAARVDPVPADRPRWP